MITPELLKSYVAQGLSVFPVILSPDGNKVQKRPAIEWKTYMTRFATDSEIDVWFGMLEFNAVGLATGRVSNITVLDIDDPNTLYGFESSVKVKTISGGTHLYFKWKPGIRNTVRVGEKPIDVRGDGGFVVIPPSSLGDKKYEWLVQDFSTLPDFPLLPSKPEIPNTTMAELPLAGEGQRNHTAIRVAGHMISNVKRNGRETVAWPAFVHWNDTMVSPPLDEVELRRTFDSASRMQDVNHPTKESAIKIYEGNQIELAWETKTKLWGSGVSTSYPELDELFTFLPEHVYIIAAPTFHGKTTLALNMAARIASFDTRVLFCSLEQGLFISPKIKNIVGGSVPKKFMILESDEFLTAEMLTKAIDSLANRPRLVVIDHLHFMKKDLSNGITGGIDKLVHDLQQHAKKTQLPFVVITHLRKLNDDRSPSIDDLRDSSTLGQVPSVVVLLKKRKDRTTLLDSRTGDLYVFKNRITGEEGHLEYTIDSDQRLELRSYNPVPDTKYTNYKD